MDVNPPSSAWVPSFRDIARRGTFWPLGFDRLPTALPIAVDTVKGLARDSLEP